MQKYLDKLPKKQKYDGNDLESACDAYGYAFTDWGEVVRYEQAIDECTNALPEIIEMVRRDERENIMKEVFTSLQELLPVKELTMGGGCVKVNPLPEDNK